VLPASSQFEKWEATFFTFEFPRNTFHLRAPVLDPLRGTLGEPEIYARLIRHLDVVPRARLGLLRGAARLGRTPFKLAFAALAAADKRILALAPYLLYETLGPTLPDGARSAAVLWALAQRIARQHPKAMRRAGHTSADTLFDAMLAARSGMTFTQDEPGDAWRYVAHPGHRIPLAIPELLDLLAGLDKTTAVHTSDEFPFILAAGQRRAFTANTIFRDAGWRLRDRDGALRINPEDARRLGLDNGAPARITTSRGTARAIVEIDDRLQPGNAALPNGFGLDLPTPAGATERTGVALNNLTDRRWRDPIAGTPWHKHVPARIEPVPS
jgi:anaerobic selenocysteine-containing dehydrogenase